MNFRTWCIVFILFTKQLFPQSSTDSLKLLLKQTRSDTAKLRILALLSEVCDEKDIPLYTTQGMELAKNILKSSAEPSLQIANVETDPTKTQLPPKVKKSVFNYYGRILDSHGLYEISQGNNQTGIKYFEKAFKLQSENNDSMAMASTLSNIGLNFYYIGQNLKAIDAMNKSLEFYKKLNDKLGMAGAYTGLSIAYRNQGDMLKGIDYVYKSLSISEELKDEQSIAN
ncbi:MAG: tetratricopeptide repeat protein, partial [Bacteroidia bacterium]